MAIGKLIRMNRLFAHPSGRLCSIAVAQSATIGCNVWGVDNITAAVRAFKAVIHDGQSAQEAMPLVGL